MSLVRYLSGTLVLGLIVFVLLVVVVIRDRTVLEPLPLGSDSLRVQAPGSTDLGDGFVRHDGEAMSSELLVTLPMGDAGASVAASVLARARAVDLEMSEWKPGSSLSAVNRNAGGDPVTVPRSLRGLLARGIEIGDRTGGAFDVTWAALWGVWDFRADPPRLPDSQMIAERVARIDYRNVELNEAAGTVRLREPGMVLGLGGIAKGYALDEGARIAREAGIGDFLLQSGGQVLAGGLRNGRPWRIGVRDPRGGPDDLFATLEITDVSVSTSGDYERFFILDGVRYHHILDPRTGRPARGVRAATVVAPDATLADALSTALLVMGTADGLRLVETMPGVEALLVDDRGVLRRSSGIDAMLTVHRDPYAVGPDTADTKEREEP